MSPGPLEFVSVVQAATRPANGRWRAPVSLSPEGQLATDPRVAVDARGNATAIWNRSDLEGASSVMSSARPAGT